MTESFEFHYLQTRYIKAATDKIASYRPDGLDPAGVAAKLTAADLVRTADTDSETAYELAHGGLSVTSKLSHDWAISIRARMKTRYRADQKSLATIEEIPTGDETDKDRLQRCRKSRSVWASLPNDPKTGLPFVAQRGAEMMNLAQFTTLLTSFETQWGANIDAATAYEKAHGEYVDMDEALGEFATAALEEGRTTYAPGTPERAIIDDVPIEPGTQAPSQAVIALATSPGAGQVHLDYSANHATSYDVLQKAPGATDFVLVADDRIEKTYDATGLTAGSYDYKVIGQNVSKGNGPESAVSTVVVG